MADTLKTPLPELVPAYVRHSVRAVEHRKPDADFWAFDEVNRRVSKANQPEDAWEVVTAIIRAAPDETLSYIGAGPVEDLVRNHGSALIEWIEGEARRDSRFQFALSCIWVGEDDFPPPIFARIRRAMVELENDSRAT